MLLILKKLLVDSIDRCSRKSATCKSMDIEKRFMQESGVHAMYHNKETTCLQELRLFNGHCFVFQQTTWIFSS